MFGESNNDRIIKARIPFLLGKVVLLLDNPFEPIRVNGPYFWDEVKERLSCIGYKFVILPELLSDINPVVAAYLFPGFEIPDANALYSQILDIAGIANRSGFIYKKGRRTYFKDLSAPGIEPGLALDNLISFLALEPKSMAELPLEKPKKAMVKKVNKAEKSGPLLSILWNKVEEAALKVYDEASESESIQKSEDELDDRTMEILSDVRQLLKAHNLTLEELRLIIGYKVQLSHMDITHSGKIFLRDFKDKETGQPIEIKMDALTKMVYFFYLRHPEGIRIKDVDGHIDELMHIYMGITGRDDKDAIRASILGHVGPYSNSINVSMSRIRAAFKNKVDKDVAKFYWIEGTGGERYRVAIDRDYVRWEY